MLDMIGSLTGMTAIAVNLVAITTVLNLSLRRRLVLAGGFGAWVGLASALAAAGALTFSPEQPVPLIGVLAAAPLIAAAFCWFFVPGFRAALLALPTPELFGAPVMFGQPKNAMQFDSVWLDGTPKLGNDITYRTVHALCDAMIGQLQSRSGLTGKLRRYLMANLLRPIRLDDAAEALNLSPRTLRRKLGEENSSFREIVDELRWRWLSATSARRGSPSKTSPNSSASAT
jgi:hypothetical protein